MRLARTAVAVLIVVVSAPGRADAPGQLRVDWAVDGAVTGAALVGWGVTELAQSSLTPSACRWCNPPGFDSSARRALAWSDTGAAKLASDALVVAVPAGFVVYDVLSTRNAGGLRAAGEDVLVVAEAATLTALLTQGVKYVVARQRPYATDPGAPNDPDTRLSFWSGHTAVAFAAAAAGGTVAEMRGYAGWPWVYAVGFTAAAATGYFRVAADQHWLSDVLAGAAAGTAVGLVVPWLHRSFASDRLSMTVMPGGLAISGRM